AGASQTFFNDDFRALAVPGEIRSSENVAQGFHRFEIVDGALELHLRGLSGVNGIAVNRNKSRLALEPCEEAGERRAFELEIRRQLADPLEARVGIVDGAGERRRGRVA